jgi:hypothetical protein
MKKFRGPVLHVLGVLVVLLGGLLLGYRLVSWYLSPAADQKTSLHTDRPQGVDGPRGNRRALLVGVTTYDYLDPRYHLEGPANDVTMFQKVLTESFGFRPEDIVSLTEKDGQQDRERRPTRANIEREFHKLAEQARAGDQVFILLAGHGSRQPESDPPHPQYPEPDGIDEVFLPADAHRARGRRPRIANAIIDDELGDWFRGITAKKAYVSVVFDCCHAGSMIRGTELVRQIEAGLLISPEELDRARKRAATRQRAGQVEKGTRFVRPVQDDYLVALYACRADETTPEFPQRTSSDKARYHGLLSFTLCQVLSQSLRPLTYKELIGRVQTQYALRPKGAPTPTVEGGGQDREVFGLKRWPARSALVLRQRPTGYLLLAGALHGITAGSVLVVEPPPDSAAAGRALGHVRVTEVAPTTAKVEPIAYGAMPRRAALPDRAVCRPVAVDYGVARFNLAVDLPDGPERNRILQAIEQSFEDRSSPVRIVTSPTAADWVIRLRNRKLELIEAAASRPPFALPDWNAPGFRADLASKLERLFRARNLLAVAAQLQSAEYDVELGVEVTILRHRGKDSPGSPLPLRRGEYILKKGEGVSFRLRNIGRRKVDVTLLTVGPDYRIERFFPEPGETAKASLAPGAMYQTEEGFVKEPLGVEKLVALVVPAGNPQVDFGILAQEGLDQARDNDTSLALKTPIGRLLEAALFRSGSTRGPAPAESVHTVAASILTWRTEP